MPDTSEHIIILWENYLSDRATVGQIDELYSFTANPKNDEVNYSCLLEAEARLSFHYTIPSEPPQWMLREILDNRLVVRPAHRVHFMKTAWFRYAAILILVLGVGAYLWNTNKKSEKNSPFLTTTAAEVLPGGDRATLTLADGSKIELDNAASGELAKQPGATIQKATDGRIIYSFDQSIRSQSVSYNTMSTPRGGQYQLALPDGSKVWLNAESSITFPTVFANNTRDVKITGEVYFEVKNNKEKPFIVQAGNEKIEVLGTSFNINAYPNNIATKISLVEGAVKIKNKILKPGQSFQSNKIITANIQQDLAWKNGAFDFNHVKVDEALRQLERWYNIKVVYPSGIPDIELIGRMSRSLSLNSVLTALEGAELKFELKDHVLIVIP